MFFKKKNKVVTKCYRLKSKVTTNCSQLNDKIVTIGYALTRKTLHFVTV